MKRLTLPLLIVLLLSTVARADLAGAIDATCRVTATDGGMGTGCVFERSAGHLFILTNAHVASSPTVECEFWRDGHLSRPLPAEVIARDVHVDAAIVRIGEAVFQGRLPRVVQLAARGSRLLPGATITSVGCAGGRWSTGWKGHVLADDGREVRFVPPPANGRSGSALFDPHGQKIVGLIKARTMDDSTGIAVSVGALYGAFSPASTRPSFRPGTKAPTDGRSSNADDSNVAARGCPSGGCTLGLLPFGRDERQPQQPGAPWPTLPVDGTSGGTRGGMDLSSVERRLERIALLIEELDRQRDGTPAPPTSGEIADELTLRQRLAERLDGTAGFTMGKMIATALGLSAPLSIALAVGLWLIARRLSDKLASGEPLLIEKLFDRVDGKIDRLRDRLEDRLVRPEKTDAK